MYWNPIGTNYNFQIHLKFQMLEIPYGKIKLIMETGHMHLFHDDSFYRLVMLFLAYGIRIQQNSMFPAYISNEISEKYQI